MDYEQFNNNNINLQQITKILFKRKLKQLEINNYKNGNSNINVNSINLDENIQNDLKNDYSDGLLLNNSNKIMSKTINQRKYQSIFDIESNYKKNMGIVDIPSIGLNRFYPLMKDPQLNCIEKFERGGINTVLQDLDNYKC
tara:strand:- start:3824 stop:4246 length:423 start_codon:yes stop_codon:yes gene_type:complete